VNSGSGNRPLLRFHSDKDRLDSWSPVT